MGKGEQERREIKYNDMERRPPENAGLAWRRKPAYINYAPDGRLKRGVWQISPKSIY